MKKRHIAAAAIVLAAVITLPVDARPEQAPAPVPSEETRRNDVTRLLRESEKVVDALSTTVGTAISPLVGITAIGAVGYYRTDADERGQLPWFNQPWFWLSALAMLAAITLKDTIGSINPMLKKPLDALELVENQVSALVALPIVIPTVMQLLDRTVVAGAAGGGWLVPVVHAAQDAGSLAAPEPGLLSGLVVGLAATVVFVVVWFTGHVANVLVLLNPIPFVDTCIKAARLTVIGVILAAAALSPTLGTALSVLVFALSLWLFGWSFRLTHFGSCMAWDILLRRSSSIMDGHAEVRGFTAAVFRGAPPRTYGRLRHRGDGHLEFRWRRFLVFPARTITLEPGARKIGTGLVTPTLVQWRTDDEFVVLFRLLPRYRGDEAAVARVLGVDGVTDASILRGLRAAWRWVRSLWAEERTARAGFH